MAVDWGLSLLVKNLEKYIPVRFLLSFKESTSRYHSSIMFVCSTRF